MSKEEITQQYNQLLKDVKEKEFYTGIDLTNRVNCYSCKNCGHVIKTIDIDAGVTPFMTDCDNCDNLSQSSFYNDTYPWKSITYEWHRPSLEELLKESPGTIEHVLRGGLIKKKCEPIEGRKVIVFKGKGNNASISEIINSSELQKKIDDWIGSIGIDVSMMNDAFLLATKNSRAEFDKLSKATCDFSEILKPFKSHELGEKERERLVKADFNKGGTGGKYNSDKAARTMEKNRKRRKAKKKSKKKSKY